MLLEIELHFLVLIVLFGEVIGLLYAYVRVVVWRGAVRERRFSGLTFARVTFWRLILFPVEASGGRLGRYDRDEGWMTTGLKEAVHLPYYKSVTSSEIRRAWLWYWSSMMLLWWGVMFSNGAELMIHYVLVSPLRWLRVLTRPWRHRFHHW